jgi:hypothetical protein
LRTFESNTAMVSDCSLDFVGCGARIKRQSDAERKREHSYVR